MGREHKKRRQMKIRQRQKRREKLAKLRKKYQESETKEDKQKIWEKVKKIAPWLTLENFLNSKNKIEEKS